jgi:gas vesicle structural protein
VNRAPTLANTPPSASGLDDDVTLLELLDRVLNTGVVVVGDLTVSVAGVELVYVSLRALLTSVESARGLKDFDFDAPTRQLAGALEAGAKS